MKAKKISMCTLIWLLVLLIVAPPWVFAQGQEGKQKFTQEELDQMLAPIALYSDSLLAQILMAATYPLEVVEADRWVQANKKLKGDALNTALDQKNWDPSVKALVPFPQVLAMLSQKLEWMQKLGDAFLDQEGDVMDTVQKLRAKAQDAGNLKTTNEQKVVVVEKVIQIEPASPEMIYVPVYNPVVVYGPWWYPAYPPFFYYPPGVIIAPGIVWFGIGVVVWPAWYAWGHWNWHHHSIYVNVNRNVVFQRTVIRHADIQTTRWQHDSSHRRGVAYRNESTRERFGQAKRPGVESRRDFRGFEGRERQTTGADRQGLDQRRKAGGIERSGIDRSRDRSAFGGMGRGSDARSQSERGRQSSRSMSPRGGSGGMHRQ